MYSSRLTDGITLFNSVSACMYVYMCVYACIGQHTTKKRASRAIGAIIAMLVNVAYISYVVFGHETIDVKNIPISILWIVCANLLIFFATDMIVEAMRCVKRKKIGGESHSL